MTQPIQEPTVHRALAGSRWNENQLYRRPAPAGPTIEIFRAARYLTSVTVAGTTQVTVDWDYWEYCSDAGIFEPLNTSLGPASPGQQVRRVELDVNTNPGRYTFMWGAHNASAIAGTVEMSIHDGDPVWSRPESVLHGTNTGLTVGFYQMTMSRVYPLLDPFGSGAQNIQVSFTLAQNGGSSEDFSELVMEIHYEANVTICEGIS